MNEIHRRTALSALGLAGIAAAAKAGPLNPPSGTVASTNKTLQEIADKVARTDSGFAEPRTPVSAATTPGNAFYLFRITQPGSYYLTGNIQAPPGWTGGGIEITVSDVALDLNGFTITGVGGTGGTQPGIAGNVTGLSRIRVSNGTVRAWRSAGVLLLARSIVTDVTSEGNAGTGIGVGTDGILTRCTATTNACSGIVTSNHCTLLQCIAQGNGTHGIIAASGSVAALCTSNNNALDGFSSLSSVHNCSAISNGDDGFASCAVVDSCLANSNVDNGFDTCSLVRGCVSNSNAGDGAASSAQVIHSRFNGNTGAGVRSADLVIGCTFEGNTANGVNVTTGAAVIDNRFERPSATTATIQAGSRCLIRGNTIVYGGTGIDVSIHSLVEGNVISIVRPSTGAVPSINVLSSTVRHNVVSDCDGVGIQHSSGSVIMGNHCQGNTGADFSGVGLLGPVITTQVGMNTAVATSNFST